MSVPEATIRKRRILVIDDSGFNRRQISRILQDDYEMIMAKDGRAGLDLLEREATTPDAILLDIVMPQLDGIQTLRIIRKDARWHALPVLVISGVKDRDKIIEALSAGATDFICKPLEREIILFRLTRAMNLATIRSAGSEEDKSVSETHV